MAPFSESVFTDPKVYNESLKPKVQYLDFEILLVAHLGDIYQSLVAFQKKESSFSPKSVYYVDYYGSWNSCQFLDICLFESKLSCNNDNLVVCNCYGAYYWSRH